MKYIIVKNHKELSKKATEIIEDQIVKKANSILGLATGFTPELTYEMLVSKKLDWSKITTFNLDEYIGISSDHEMSYRTFMNKHLFSKVNIDIDNTHLPCNHGDTVAEGKNYDKEIEEKGGVDLQVLGIGVNGHIGFVEPGSDANMGTSPVDLTPTTIEVNSRYFNSIDDVPKKAISMGIKTILSAKKIILLASGSSKADAIAKTIEGPITMDVPSSYLQKHDDVTIIIDEEAAANLTT